MKMSQRYDRVAEVWEGVKIPPLTMHEAERAIRKLLRTEGCRHDIMCMKQVTGNRETWVRGITWSVNTSRGWGHLIHAVSHWVHLMQYRYEKPHGKSHWRIELRMRKRALRSGWLEGSLLPKTKKAKAPPTKCEVRAEKIKRRREQIKRLDTKIKSLTTRRQTAARSLRALEYRQSYDEATERKEEA